MPCRAINSNDSVDERQPTYSLNTGVVWAASRCETSSSHPDPHTLQLLPSQAAAAISDRGGDSADFSNAFADKIDALAERK